MLHMRSSLEPSNRPRQVQYVARGNLRMSQLFPGWRRLSGREGSLENMYLGRRKGSKDGLGGVSIRRNDSQDDICISIKDSLHFDLFQTHPFPGFTPKASLALLRDVDVI